MKSANKWEKAELGDTKRKNKFLRLMGASRVSTAILVSFYSYNQTPIFVYIHIFRQLLSRVQLLQIMSTLVSEKVQQKMHSIQFAKCSNIYPLRDVTQASTNRRWSASWSSSFSRESSFDAVEARDVIAGSASPRSSSCQLQASRICTFRIQ